MTYNQKVIQSMAFLLRKRYDAIEKLPAMMFLKEYYPHRKASDWLKAYYIAFED